MKITFEQIKDKIIHFVFLRGDSICNDGLKKLNSLSNEAQICELFKYYSHHLTFFNNDNEFTTYLDLLIDLKNNFEGVYSTCYDIIIDSVVYHCALEFNSFYEVKKHLEINSFIELVELNMFDNFEKKFNSIKYALELMKNLQVEEL